DDLDALDRIDVGVHVAHPEPGLVQVFGQRLGHPLGQGGHQHAMALGGGVAETKMVWPRNLSHSSNLSGRLSVHEGRRKPNSASVDLRVQSPPNMPPSCGTVTWLSSTMTSASRCMYSKKVGGGSPGLRPVR